jgi:hypothetical protein
MWHVWGKGEVSREFWWGNLKRPLGKLGLKWKNNIKLDLKSVGKSWTDLCGTGQEHAVGSCESGNKPSGSIKCGEFLD